MTNPELIKKEPLTLSQDETEGPLRASRKDRIFLRHPIMQEAQLHNLLKNKWRIVSREYGPVYLGSKTNLKSGYLLSLKKLGRYKFLFSLIPYPENK